MPPIALAAIQLDPASTIREQLDAGRVDDFRELYLAHGAEVLPPLLVAPSAAGYTLLDGYHRYHALAGMDAPPADVPAEVVAPPEGSNPQAWALTEAIKANAYHGQPLKRAERMALAARLFELDPTLTTVAVARICGVSQPTAWRIQQKGPRPSEPASPRKAPREPEPEAIARQLVRSFGRLAEACNRPVRGGIDTKRAASVLAYACDDLYQDNEAAAAMLDTMSQALTQALAQWGNMYEPA